MGAGRPTTAAGLTHATLLFRFADDSPMGRPRRFPRICPSADASAVGQEPTNLYYSRLHVIFGR